MAAHGGARKGAGRPRIAAKTRTIPTRVGVEQSEAWALRARQLGQSLSAWTRATLDDATPIACQVAAKFADGAWALADGTELIAVIDTHGAALAAHGPDERWQFADGSAIILGQEVWDIGFDDLADCACFAGLEIDNAETGGHDPGCPHASEACAYCDRSIAADFLGVPSVDDDEHWKELAPLHEDDCEWIETRAHRIT